MSGGGERQLDSAELDGPLERGVDRAGRLAEVAEHQLAQLVDDLGVAVRSEHVHECLRGHDLPERRGERGRARFETHALDLVEHLVEPVRMVVARELGVDDRRPGPAAACAGLRGPRRAAGAD